MLGNGERGAGSGTKVLPGTPPESSRRSAMLVPMLVLGLAAAQAPTELHARREPQVGFAVDEAFQARGGVQYYFAMAARPSTEFAPLDPSRTPTPHVVMSRLVHTLNKDADFFSAARVVDVDYINAIGPQFKVTKLGPGRFHADRSPSNDFTVVHYDEAALAVRPREPALDQVEALCGAGPASVVAQHNTGFARVLGWRTAEAGFTWTAHYRLGPGRTRVCVLTMSLLINIPPFFVGGRNRLHEESLKETLALIAALRAWEPPAQ